MCNVITRGTSESVQILHPNITVYWTIRHHDQQPRSAQCGVNIISKLLIKRTATPPSFTEFTLIILFYGTHFLEN